MVNYLDYVMFWNFKLNFEILGFCGKGFLFVRKKYFLLLVMKNFLLFNLLKDFVNILVKVYLLFIEVFLVIVWNDLIFSL